MTTVHYRDEQVTLLLGDALEVLRTLPDGSVDCIVTSPPYWKQRDYEVEGQYGQEETAAAFVGTLRAVFVEARRVLADDGTCWINIDDTRIDKELCLVPEQLLIGMRDDGWIVRNKAIWHVTNSMPESARDRLSHRYENLHLLTKTRRNWFDPDPIREPYSEASVAHAEKYGGRYGQVYGAPGESRNGRDGSTLRMAERHPLGRLPGDVWAFPTRPNKSGRKVHFAPYPIDIPLRAIAAGCKPGGVVLDPFSGSGTTGAAALHLDRKYVGIDLNAEYHELALRERLSQTALDLTAPDPAA